MEGIFIYRAKVLSGKKNLGLSGRTMHQNKNCIVKELNPNFSYLQCSPWPDTPTTFVNNSPTPAPTFTSAQHNTYSVPDRSVSFSVTEIAFLNQAYSKVLSEWVQKLATVSWFHWGMREIFIVLSYTFILECDNVWFNYNVTYFALTFFFHAVHCWKLFFSSFGI